MGLETESRKVGDLLKVTELESRNPRCLSLKLFNWWLTS